MKSKFECSRDVNARRPRVATRAALQDPRALAFACLLALLCACDPAPKYAKPPAQTPTAFKEAVPQQYREGEGWKIAEPSDDRIRSKWWEIYNDPQLNALEQQVQISNQSIQAAEANFRSARAVVVSARSSLFPTLSSSASYTNSRFSQTSRGARVVGGNTSTTTTTTTGTTGTSTGTTGSTSTSTTGSTSTGSSSGSPSTGVGGTSSTGTINDFSLPFQFSYVVDMWHRIRNTVAANAYQAQASAADVATALLSTQAELAQDYFQIRALDAQRKILQDTVANYRQDLELTLSRFKAGIASEEDVSQARTQLDTAIAQATDLGVSRATYEHAIAMLIGKPPANFSLPVAAFTPKPPAVPVALPSKLLERRPDIAAAERRVAAANAQIGVARTAYYPNLTFNATAGFETSTFAQWFDWPSRFWSLGPQLGATLIDVGARRALNEEAQAAYDQAVANYRQTVLGAFQAVEDNLSTLRILSREIVEQHTAVESANHFLDLSLTRYKGGVDSYLNVITAENTVLSNRETELGIQLRQMTASVSLIMALGGGWDFAEIPNYKNLLAKPPKRTPAGAQPVNTSAPVAPPNPPPLNPALPVPGAPNSSPANPQPINTPSPSGR